MSTSNESSSGRFADFGLSVADCLALPPLTRASVEGGHAGLQRRARWVHVVDHEDIEDSLTGSELLLSSGVSLGHNPSLQQAIFPVMQRRASAGLILAIGPYLDRVPDGMRREADRVGIPIIAMPWEVNFRDITEVLLTRLVTEQYRLLEEAERVNRGLLAVVLDRGDLDLLCARLSEVTRQRVAVVDPQFRVLGEDPQARGDTHFPRGFARPAATSRGVTRIAGPDGRYALAAPVVITGRLSAYVLMTTAGNEPERFEAMLAESATLAAALLIAQRDEIERARSAHERDALLALIEGREDPALVAALGLASAAAFSILVVEVAEGAAIDRRLIRHALEPVAPRARIFERAGQYVVVAPHARRLQPKTVAAALAEGMEAAGVGFRAGLSDPVETPAQASRAYADAREALEVGRRLDPSRACFLARDTAAVAHFVRLLESGPPVRFTRIRKLAEHDQNHRGELLQTLDSFLAANQNAVLAARRLSIHRHTLAYRLDRIGDILGCELTPEICFDLRLELVAHKMGRTVD